MNLLDTRSWSPEHFLCAGATLGDRDIAIPGQRKKRQEALEGSCALGMMDWPPQRGVFEDRTNPSPSG